MGIDDHEAHDDGLAAMAWWNGLKDHERTYWGTRAQTWVPADAWSIHKAERHVLACPALSSAVAGASVTAKHTGLLKAVRNVDGFENAELARVDKSGNTWLIRRKVLDAEGRVVHDDHSQWLSDELNADGGRASKTRRRLAALGFHLSRCAVTTLRLIVDRGGEQANIVQATVEQLTESIDCRLFDSLEGWRSPRDLQDLVEEAVGPELVKPEERSPIGKPHYQLREVVDVSRFLRAAQALHRDRAEAFSRRGLAVTVIPEVGESRDEVLTGAELDPDWGRYACRERRMFSDWSASSAGRSGARIWRSWTFQFADSVDRDGQRWMSFVPEWTTTLKIAKLTVRPLTDEEVFDRLLAIDARLGVPFVWFFFMLHGNRVRDGAGERILEAVNAGRLTLPQHDLSVLEAWAARPYGF